MNWPEHLLIGLFVGGAIAAFMGLSPFMIILAAAIAGFSALAPDIDHESSKVRQITDISVPVFALFISISGGCSGFSCSFEDWQGIIISALAMVGAYAILLTYFKTKHRGITHTIVVALLYGALIFLMSNFTFAIFALAGYTSHLLADMHIKLI